MIKWLFAGLAVLALSGLVMAISLTLAFIASETPMTHDQFLATVHASHVTWYAALGVQLLGAWVSWRGFPRSESRLLKYASVVAACDIGSLLTSFVLLNSPRVWTALRALT
jgi:O-antigen/teichoic acid export membrane protein